MLGKEDTIYKDMIQKTAMHWLEEVASSEEVTVREGAKLTLEYIESLKKQIEILEDKNKLKDTFLKRLKSKQASS